MPTKADLKRYQANLSDERDAAVLYRALAKSESNPRLAELYERLAVTEEGHAAAWQQQLEAAGALVPHFRPSWRSRVLAWLARRRGAGFVLPTLTQVEQNAVGGYARQPEAADMVADEQAHARLFRELTAGGAPAGGKLGQLEGRHRSAGGNALRAAVLGASDGLLSNFNLIAGVAGAALSNKSILLTGFAGLLAGAISMALGEWISVQSSRELYQKQLRTEAEEIAATPEEEAEELALIYRARGMEETAARDLAQRILSDREGALRALAHDELGIDPDELGGSAWEAALTSFALFAVGALLPVVPYLFMRGESAIVASAGLSTVGLFAVGAAITLFTGRSVLWSGLRQVAFGLAAAAVVYAVGHLLGVGLRG